MRRFTSFLLLLTALFLFSCGKSDGFKTVKADTDGNIHIPVSDITETATFYNYHANGTTVQLVALRDAAGEVHAAFNTCQSCSPSPKAYYQQKDDELICQNCGFDFTPEQVGVVSGGCNPTPVQGLTESGGELIIPASSFEGMRDKFLRWGGPTKS